MENKKSNNFGRLSKARLVKVTTALDVMGNCSNRSAYEYSEADVVGIFNKIEEKVRQTKSRFKFEHAVALPGEVGTKTWKQLATGLKSHGSLNHAFSRTQWGKHCVRFYVKDSIFWITCYTANFKDPQNRVYGIFLSHPGYFEPSNTKESDESPIDSLRSLIEKNKVQLRKALPEADIAGHDDYSGLSGWMRELSDFSSDEEAIEWQKGMLDTFADLYVPLIKQVG